MVILEVASRVQGFKGQANPFDTGARGITQKEVQFRETDAGELKTERVYLN